MGKTVALFQDMRRDTAKEIYVKNIVEKFSELNKTVDALQEKLKSASPEVIEETKKQLEVLQKIMDEYAVYSNLASYIETDVENLKDKIKYILSKIKCKQIGGFRFSQMKGRESLDGKAIGEIMTKLEELSKSNLSAEDLKKELSLLVKKPIKTTSAPSVQLREISENFAEFE